MFTCKHDQVRSNEVDQLRDKSKISSLHPNYPQYPLYILLTTQTKSIVQVTNYNYNTPFISFTELSLFIWDTMRSLNCTVSVIIIYINQCLSCWGWNNIQTVLKWSDFGPWSDPWENNFFLVTKFPPTESYASVVNGIQLEMFVALAEYFAFEFPWYHQ